MPGGNTPEHSPVNHSATVTRMAFPSPDATTLGCRILPSEEHVATTGTITYFVYLEKDFTVSSIRG